MTKDKKYIENLFRNYKRNKARLKILELNMLDDSDNELNGIDYSSVSVQTSNIASLDNIIVAREKEVVRLKKAIATTEILLDSLNGRKDDQYRKVIEHYYIENKMYTEVMPILNLYDYSNFQKLCRTVLNSMVDLVN